MSYQFTNWHIINTHTRHIPALYFDLMPSVAFNGHIENEFIAKPTPIIIILFEDINKIYTTWCAAHNVKSNALALCDRHPRRRRSKLIEDRPHAAALPPETLLSITLAYRSYHTHTHRFEVLFDIGMIYTMCIHFEPFRRRTYIHILTQSAGVRGSCRHGRHVLLIHLYVVRYTNVRANAQTNSRSRDLIRMFSVWVCECCTYVHINITYTYVRMVWPSLFSICDNNHLSYTQSIHEYVFNCFWWRFDV